MTLVVQNLRNATPDLLARAKSVADVAAGGKIGLGIEIGIEKATTEGAELSE